MKFLFLFILMLMAFSSSAMEDLAALKKKVDAVVLPQIEAGVGPSLVIGVISGNKQAIWSYGTTQIDSKNKPNGKTLYEIGSITKTFTGTLLALLVIENKLKLQDPVEKYLPQLKNTDTGKISLVQLATHTSGLPRMPDNLPMANEANPYADYTFDLMINFLKNHKIPSVIHQFDYSNLGVALLGQVLSQVSGQNFEELVKSKILKPLKMNSTTITLSTRQKN